MAQREKEYWEDKEFSFFCHKDCEYFPCHPTEDPENFNCLFCYCPLYVLGPDCGGNCRYLDNGIKDCSGCKLPHGRNSYGYIAKKFQDIVAAARKPGEEGGKEHG